MNTSKPKKKRFQIIDKGNHVVIKDLMTSTYHSYPKDTNQIKTESL